MATGIRDRVAILGMGCSRFGERWSDNAEDLMLEAYSEALADARIEKNQIEAAWLGVCLEENNVGKTAGPLAQGLRLPFIAATRVENACATGTEALRGAVYAVASGAYDVALALGVEKLKDTGYGGLPVRTRGIVPDLWQPNASAPGAFAQLATAYQARYGISLEDLKRAMAHVSVKSHDNAALNPKAHLRNRITIEDVLKAPTVAAPLGLYDCCGVSDGAACAIVTTVETAKRLGRRDMVTVKALQVAVSNGEEAQFNTWDGASIRTAEVAAARAYREAGIDDPRAALDLIEVHDCFSITELVLMESLGLSDPGRAPYDILDGRYDRGGAIPCQVDGGLKCFGHPIGASGLRMVYELYQQILGRAGERQLPKADLGLTQNLGGHPHQNVCAISIIGRLGA
ncbi:Acyl-CoA acetyltransferase [Castellaniella defragrans 65Phen]|uniref:Acyl-CoA acetyltransferase n=2 Tax=Castellaniella defragrans TaxID=75697 RepID=W8X098_CASD6|nr:acetyl-CoA acetyltransferase [Castellaniella defragrans]KAB0622751.1 acetyl-CoA acetyltransferase [Castellaniella defragrans]MBB6085231.1 acetyl-CoA C-acetyltransferase [Castellaniella defragrans]CDM25299.1 Acyl-CoA acetyltransferase [Castellaniella defragrans 65Phen]